MAEEENIELNTVSITIGKTDLNKQQKLILEQVYNRVREEMVEIIGQFNSSDKPDPGVVTKSILDIVCLYMKVMEKVKVNGRPLAGEDKKLIAIEVGRVAIKSEITNVGLKENVLSIYNLSAEPLLENILEVTKQVNTISKKGGLFCCFSKK